MGTYDKDDEEADRIYQQIDDRMAERSRKRQRVEEKKEVDVQDQFKDLKRDLGKLTEEEWANIPDPGDLVTAGRKLKKMQEKDYFTKAPDTLLQAARASATELGRSVAVTEEDEESGDMGESDLRGMSKARDDLLRAKLDQLHKDADAEKATVDAKGYLSSLSSIMVKSDTEIGDIKRARELLRSVVQSNPKHAPGWIAAARVEELDGKVSVAKKLLEKGCNECPWSEDIWLETARIHSGDEARSILAKAVDFLPDSVSLWIKSAELQSDTKGKKRILRNALENIVDSVELWKAAVELEDDAQDARLMLEEATRCIPNSVELWIARARLGSYEESKNVLNEAFQAIPTNHEIWIAAAKLEESSGNLESVDKFIATVVNTLAEVGSNLTREQWILEAEKCEKAEYVHTCQAIINHTLNIDVDEDNELDTWLDDAQASVARGSIGTARAIYSQILKKHPNDDYVWMEAAFMEKKHGTPEQVEELLKHSVKYCPNAADLWLMRAKENWLNGKTDDARRVLQEAFEVNKKNEKIWLAAVKLEIESNEYERSRNILRDARQVADTPKIWMKSVVLERNLGNFEEALSILEEGLRKYSTFDKLWMIKGQILDKLNNTVQAEKTYADAVKKCPKSAPLWILYSRLIERKNSLARVRALLDQARLSNPVSEDLWLESVRVEVRSGNMTQAKALMAKGMQACPSSGKLLAESLLLEPRAVRRAKSVDALKKAQNDSYILLSVGKMFWSERAIDKARSWLNKAVVADPKFGDGWIYLYRFEQDNGGVEQQENVAKRCVEAAPNKGELWLKYSKDPQNWRLNTEEILRLAKVDDIL